MPSTCLPAIGPDHPSIPREVLDSLSAQQRAALLRERDLEYRREELAAGFDSRCEDES